MRARWIVSAALVVWTSGLMLATPELQDRQNVPDLSLSPDLRHVFLVVVDRADGSKTSEVPNDVTESAYVENIPARLAVGDAQDRRRLAILDLETGKSVFAESDFAGGSKARDGVDVYARLFTPEMIGAKRDAAHPGVIFVHGAARARS